MLSRSYCLFILIASLFSFINFTFTQEFKAWSNQTSNIRMIYEFESDSTVHKYVKGTDLKTVVEASAKSVGFSVTEASDNVVLVSIKTDVLKPNSTLPFIRIRVVVGPDANASFSANGSNDFSGNSEIVQERLIEQSMATSSQILSVVQSLSQMSLNKAKQKMFSKRSNLYKSKRKWWSRDDDELPKEIEGVDVNQ